VQEFSNIIALEMAFNAFEYRYSGKGIKELERQKEEEKAKRS
jgi:hypothetical protein